MNHQYIEVPGGDHGSVISSQQADIFAFFADTRAELPTIQNSRPASLRSPLVAFNGG